MSKWRKMIFIVGLLNLVLMPVVFLFGTKSDTHRALESYLSANHAGPREREAYFFALERPDVLKVLPCYCGCTHEGHKSNYNCFFKESGNPNEADTIDHHGLHCPMCVDIALQGKGMISGGASLREIRQTVDGFFAEYPFLESTKTPMPGH